MKQWWRSEALYSRVGSWNSKLESLRPKLESQLESLRSRLGVLSQPPVIGAFIVFATFVVKDWIRDYVKDEVDTVNAAEVAFQSRNDTFTTWTHLAVIEGQLTNIAFATSHQSNHPKKAEAKQPPADDAGFRNLEIMIVQKESSELSEIDTLSEKLPSSVHDRIRTQSTALYKDLGALVNRVMSPTQDDKVLEDLGPLGIRVDELTGQVYPEFEREKDSLENLYLRVRYLSYVFFFLGWWTGLEGLIKRKGSHADAGRDTGTE